jgi:hypothetical protein
LRAGKKSKTVITEERIAKLEEIGFSWRRKKLSINKGGKFAAYADEDESGSEEESDDDEQLDHHSEGVDRDSARTQNTTAPWQRYDAGRF